MFIQRCDNHFTTNISNIKINNIDRYLTVLNLMLLRIQSVRRKLRKLISKRATNKVNKHLLRHPEVAKVTLWWPTIIVADPLSPPQSTCGLYPWTTPVQYHVIITVQKQQFFITHFLLQKLKLEQLIIIKTNVCTVINV